VHNGADRHGRKRHGIAGLHVDSVAGNHDIAGGKPLRRDDIGELTIAIFDQCNEGRAVGIVFEMLHRCGRIMLVPLEVDDAVGLLVATALPSHRDAAEYCCAHRDAFVLRSES
jgi:hypothetical protein